MKSLIKAFKLAKLSGVSAWIICFSLIPVAIAGILMIALNSVINMQIGFMILEILPMMVHASYGQIMDSRFVHMVPDRKALQINSNTAFYAFLVGVVRVIEFIFLAVLLNTKTIVPELASYLLISASVMTIIYALFSSLIRKSNILGFLSILLMIPWFIFSVKNNQLFFQPLEVAVGIFLGAAVIAVIIYYIITKACYKMPLSSGYEQPAL